jgi:hypothetical protein
MTLMTYCYFIICIDGVTVGPSEAEYHKSLADQDNFGYVVLWSTNWGYAPPPLKPGVA